MSNSVTLTGNLTRDPELRFTNSGMASARAGLAVNRRRKNAAGEWDESTSFFDIICWGDLGENVAESLTKGARVVVTGRLEQRTYDKDGEQRSVVEVIADDIGPSLRFATATVARTERKTSPSSPAPAAGPTPYDEEPF